MRRRPNPATSTWRRCGDEDVVNFEQNGAISDKGLALILNVLARTAPASGTAGEPDRTARTCCAAWAVSNAGT